MKRWQPKPTTPEGYPQEHCPMDLGEDQGYLTGSACSADSLSPTSLKSAPEERDTMDTTDESSPIHPSKTFYDAISLELELCGFFTSALTKSEIDKSHKLATEERKRMIERGSAAIKFTRVAPTHKTTIGNQPSLFSVPKVARSKREHSSEGSDDENPNATPASKHV